MHARFSAPFGHVLVETEEGKVTGVHLRPEAAEEEIPGGFPPGVVVAVRAYLEGRAPQPVAPMEAEGTEFQQTVWRELANIPPGRTLTYGELAAKLGKPGAARAVGQALAKNPTPLMWPCHRVVATDGLGGFGGAQDPEDPEDAGQLNIKSWLLDHESRMRKRPG